MWVMCFCFLEKVCDISLAIVSRVPDAKTLDTEQKRFANVPPTPAHAG